MFEAAFREATTQDQLHPTTLQASDHTMQCCTSVSRPVFTARCTPRPQQQAARRCGTVTAAWNPGMPDHGMGRHRQPEPPELYRSLFAAEWIPASSNPQTVWDARCVISAAAPAAPAEPAEPAATAARRRPFVCQPAPQLLAYCRRLASGTPSTAFSTTLPPLAPLQGCAGGVQWAVGRRAQRVPLCFRARRRAGGCLLLHSAHSGASS